MDDGQQDVIAFLRNPGSYPAGVRSVEILETHASLVFLAGDYAYKLKRAAKYSYLDYSTPDRRLAMCAAELQLNRRTVPDLYLDVRAISRRADGSLYWGRGGEPVDFVVVMKRFAQRDLLLAAAQDGRLSAPLLYRLTAHIAAFHEKAEKHLESGGSAAMRAIAAANIRCLRDCPAAGFTASQIDDLAKTTTAELSRVGPLLDDRRRAGEVRRVHGDLHLRNICLLDGRPVLFDAIEFSDEIATIDVLYDLAFLLMDFDHRGLRGFANLVLNRYLDLTEEDDGLAAMPLFLSLRAAIRAHVTATMAGHGRAADKPASAFAEARGYLDEAVAVLTPLPPRLVAVGGLSGSGKSSVAAWLAADLGRRPGARVLRSDVLRKLLFGAEPETPLPPEAYTPEINATVYQKLCDRAAVALRAGYAAVVDAVALKEDERHSFAAVAAAAGVPFTGLWLQTSPEIMQQRIAERRGDASDASAEVLRQQQARDPGAIDWIRLDAGGGPDETVAAARRALVH